MTGIRAQDALPPSSLIIPTRNRPAIVADTVASILAGEDVPTELVIVDQSDDQNAVLATLITTRECDVRYLWHPAVGVSRARNDGINAARHDILVFTDDDVLVTPTWFGTLVRTLVRLGPEAVVTGQVRPAEEAQGGFVLSTVVHENAAVYEGRVGVDILFPPNMAMYRSVLDDVGLFDLRLGYGARFPTAEDNDLAFRILDAGYRIHYAPEPVVHHRAWKPESEYLRLKWLYARGQGGFYGKHFSLRDRHTFWRMVSDVRLRTGRMFRGLLRDRRHAAGQIVSIAGVVSGFVEWLISRPKQP
jgi:GT2 family glycosyltransferase